MPILWDDLQALASDAQDAIARQRAIRDSAYALALAVKATVPEENALLHKHADDVLILIAERRQGRG